MLSLSEAPPLASHEWSPSSVLQIQEVREGWEVEQLLQRFDSPVEMNCRRIRKLFSRALTELPRRQHLNFSAEVLAPPEAFPLPARR
jgi:hypothetical protein